MKPADILANLAVGTPHRDQAAAAFLQLLRDMARRLLVEPRSRGVYRISFEEREEMVGRTVVRILERSPVSVVGKSDAECSKFVETTLVRIFIDEMRKRSGHEKRSEVAIDEVESQAGSGMDQADLQDKSRIILDTVMNAMLGRATDDAHRDRLRRTWKQIQLLVFDGADMHAILAQDEGIGPASSEDDRKKARDRVLTAHYRFRKSLAAEIDSMAASGDLDPVSAEFARTSIRAHLNRRQNPQPASSVANKRIKLS